MIRATIKTFGSFDGVAAVTDQLARDVAQAGAVAGRDEFERVASQRRRTGKMSDVRVIPVQGDVNGYTAGVANDPKAWYERFQDHGTLASRKKKKLHKLTHMRRATPSGQTRYAKVSGHKGITPLGFTSAARKVGKAAMRSRLARG